jgi:ferrous iron transport protein B
LGGGVPGAIRARRQVHYLLTDGILAGVGGVLVFVPVLIALYLALAVLEDSGYMTRAAFIMDRLMHTVGLHGKSFLPLVVGFGCNVPAIYATRTLENEKDRILTGLLVPFMSCGARLPVYILLATIFFPRHADLVIFSIYLVGIVVALLLGLLMKYTLFQNKQDLPLIMELPPYRLPAPRNIWLYTWSRTWSFIKQATTIILVGSVVVWTLTAIPVRGTGTFARTPLEESAFASVSGQAAHLFAPLGFGSWQISGALISGIVAKEMIVSTTAQIFHTEEAEQTDAPTMENTTVLADIGALVVGFGQAALETLQSLPRIVGIDLLGAEEEEPSGDLMQAVRGTMERSSGGHGALAALSCMLFVLIYTPCMVTVAALRQEFGNRWMWFSIVGQLLLAWLVGLLVFQGGLLFGWG